VTLSNGLDRSTIRADRYSPVRTPDLQRRALAGLLDVLWSPPTYERLPRAWNLDNTEAVRAVQWLIAKVVVAVENSESPIADA
jgi:hypothetical protein